jgi:CheY-like chemotaxis protein
MFNLTTLQTMISVKFHLETIICSSGQQACDLVNERLKKIELYNLIEKPFKLIFMDCEMPQMNGFEATKRILKTCQDAGCG